VSRSVSPHFPPLGDLLVLLILHGPYIYLYVWCSPLAEEALMRSWLKIRGALLCGFLLSLGLSNIVLADILAPETDDRTASQSERNGRYADQQDMTWLRPGFHIIQGDVLRMESGNYYVQQKDGREVRLEIDHTTEMMGQIKKGDRVVGNVDDQYHVRWISPVP